MADAKLEEDKGIVRVGAVANLGALVRDVEELRQGRAGVEESMDVDN